MLNGPRRMFPVVVDVIVGGTGRYKNAKGTGTFTGVVNRSTWAATIDATGALAY